MTYFVEGLTKHQAGDSTVRSIGEYETLEDAIRAAKQIIDEFLSNTFDPEMTAGDLFSIYQQYGEVPFIFMDGHRTLNFDGFNHFKHAMFRCSIMCPQPFPSLLSDAEFEAMKQQRSKVARSEHDRWDNKGIRNNPNLTDGRPESTIEQHFKQVAQRLVAMWPSEACGTYINLIVSDRALGKGFPQDMIEDLRMLYEINKLRLQK